jgi:hypothetical protein
MGQGVVIENFQAPSYCHYFSDSDQFFYLPQKGVVICFGKTMVKRFSKTCGMPHFLATELEKLWQLNGDHIFFNCPSLWVTKTNKKGFVIFPLFDLHLMATIESNVDN